jgi:hypothetical protein
MPAADTREQAGAKGGRGKKAVDNINSFPKGGTSEAYLLRRLKRDHPELAAKVVAGEWSAHRAAVEAGIVKLVVSHRPTVQGFLRAAQAHLSPEEQLELEERMGFDDRIMVLGFILVSLYKWDRDYFRSAKLAAYSGRSPVGRPPAPKQYAQWVTACPRRIGIEARSPQRPLQPRR